ncbi:periplasmic nitrate reductase, NapE protein [Cupriavidus agavae]|uniref:Periplasmic nitrate reductase subunit NapE n=1 Tax=Cupriavidus agavae TaxID=1001822 RepID=A0A4Q7RRU2_9BURK|nr:periplasmic nitrate reductase, NapE protein [Cupriavidus agavae]RZT36363.1 periplasmic nitrate reductase subunit NapE [Cupriavidus agavae]
MDSGSVQEPRNPQDPQRRKEELRSFLFLTAVMVPVLSVIVVAGYGFIVWMSQLISGPPTH